MTLWLLLILALDLQGYSLGVHKNATRLSDHASPQPKLMDFPPSTVLNARIRGGESAPASGNDPAILKAPKYSTSTSNLHHEIKQTTNASQTTTSPEANKKTIKSKIEDIPLEDASSSKFPVKVEFKTKSPISDPINFSANLSSPQKPPVLTPARSLTEETSSDEVTHPFSRKSNFLETNGTKTNEANVNRPMGHSNNKETSEYARATSSTVSASAMELVTLTPAETTTEMETSTLSFTEIADWSYLETNDTTTKNANENDFLYTETDAPTTSTTTDVTTEQNTEGTTEENLSIANGISAHDNQHIPGVTSPLTKLILRLSKPGVFEKGRSVFEDDPSSITTSCPPGDVGLSCRRAEARRTADECSGGNCEVCRSCNNMAAIDWPHCCRENFRCCSELALACQQCDQPTLQVFCTKHFKRCF